MTHRERTVTMAELREIYVCASDTTNPLDLDEALRRSGLAQLRRSPMGGTEWNAVYTREAAGFMFVLFPTGRWGYVVDLLTENASDRDCVLSLIRNAGWEVNPHYFTTGAREMIDR